MRHVLQKKGETILENVYNLPTVGSGALAVVVAQTIHSI